MAAARAAVPPSDPPRPGSAPGRCAWLGRMAAIAVTNVPQRHRYEARVDGEPAGFTQYRVVGDQDVFVHTVVDPAFEGRGVGSAIVRGALDDVRARGRRAVAVCPFMADWLERHPGLYDDILDEAPAQAPE